MIAGQVVPEMPRLVESLMNLANGVKVEGNSGVYVAPPDIQAIAALLAMVDCVA